MTTLQLEESKQVIETEVLPLIQRTQNLIVKNQEDRGILAIDIKKAEELKDRIEERFHFTANREKAHKVWKDLKDSENQAYGPIDAFVEAGKRAVKQFDTQEAIKEQRRAEEAEAKRREQERVEREKLEEKARKAEEKGKIEKAETLREQAENVQVAPSFAPPPQAVKKLVTKARVLNMMKLCKLIAEGVIPFTVLEINQAQLNAWAKTQDPKQKLDGIEFIQESSGRI